MSFLKSLNICFLSQLGLVLLLDSTVMANEIQYSSTTEVDLDLPPTIIENSPVLQKWLREIPSVREDILSDPSFSTRFRLGFSIFPSTTGLNLGLHDVFFGRTGITLNGDYYTSENGDRVSYGGSLDYFLLPLGNYFNIAPQVGYRYIESNNYSTDGINLGLRLMLVLSASGAADISLSQSFISPGGNNEVSLFRLAVGYSITNSLRLSSDLEIQKSTEDLDNKFGINLELLI